ncbi:prostaglandin F synthase isoform X2 [Lingula anatina]|nr:prostaglandin F synthase isoform X2 [Lingula anatina]|eukprot:XP_013378864.1 prostaglandin F synthase isoform X2 [Lingula anatina]
MAEDVTLPKIFGCDTYLKIMKQYQIFFNAGWSSTDLHLDITETFFAQVTGQRQWILTTPRDGKNAYSDDFEHHTGISQLDIESVDLINFPNVTKVDVYNITANPGDIIYVPEGWWHQVRAKGPNPPNIAIAIFLHWLNCQYEVPPGTDAEYIDGCIKIREEKPLEMTCGMKVDEAPISELMKTLKHMELETFTAIEERENWTITSDLKFETSLLKSGYEMPDLGLGLGDIPHSELKAALEYALKVGYRLFDPDLIEESESILGSVLANNKYCKREDAFVIVKVPQDSLGIDATRKSVENSLKRLQSDYLDLVLLQAPSCDPKNVECWELLKESWQTLEEMNATGSIRSLGVMDFKMKNLRDLIKIAKVPISVVHSRFDLMKRRTKLRQLCDDNGIRFMGHSIMGQKWQTEDGQNPLMSSNDLKVVSRSVHTTTQAVLIRWALDQNVTVVPRALNLLYISLNQRALMTDISEFEDIFENFPHSD